MSFGIECVVTARRNSILIVIVTIHKGLDGNTENVARADKFSCKSSDYFSPAVLIARADDVLHLRFAENGFIGNFVHRHLQIDVPRNIKEQPETPGEQCGPATVRVATRDGEKITRLDV